LCRTRHEAWHFTATCRLTLFIEATDVRGLRAALRDRVTVVMPLEKKWYGVTEFAIADPDGYLITFAEREA
jgi:uncharacterized glyoxalase superfamily protein PhnB